MAVASAGPYASAPRSRQITMPAPHHSVFYRPDALPAAQPQRQSIEGIVTDAYQIINIKSNQNDVQYKAAKPKTISRDEAIFPVFCAEV